MFPWVREDPYSQTVLESSGPDPAQKTAETEFSHKVSRQGSALSGIVFNKGKQVGTGTEASIVERVEGFPGRRRAPAWLWTTPLFLSALLFLSAFFTVIAPLPILFMGIKKGRLWAWLAALSNSLLVWWVAGVPSLITYLVFMAVMAVTVLETLLRRRSVEISAFCGLVAMALTAWIGITLYARIEKAHPVAEIRSEISEFVDYFGQGSAATGKGGTNTAAPLDPAELEEWKQSLIIELPSAVAVIALILVWVNLTILIRINPEGFKERLGIPPRFLEDWKAPEFLIWPAILSGATLLVDLGEVTDVGRNIFKFLMAIYAIQGLSILNFFFNHWKLRRIFRFLGYAVGVLVLTPLLLSLGFFDLWFDFRGKFRQS